MNVVPHTNDSASKVEGAKRVAAVSSLAFGLTFKVHQLKYFIKHELVRSFSPMCFTIIMGTGSISMLFDIFPYGQNRAMKIISLIIFLLNLCAFLMFMVWGIARFSLHPEDWGTSMRNPSYGLFWGCFPMGLATLLSTAVNLLHGNSPIWGKTLLYFLWVLWWINVAISCACCWGIVHYMVINHSYSLELMTPAWLLPVVTLIVSSSTGGVFTGALQEYSIHCAMVTAAVDVFIITIGSIMSFMIVIMYFQRLFFHGLPAGLAVLTVFLPLGPTSQAGFSIVLIGRNFKSLLPMKDSLSPFLSWAGAGQTIYTLCICIAFLFWALGSLFLIFGLLAMVSTLRKTNIGFATTFWGLIFPNGVYASLTITLGGLLDAPFFRIYGAMYAAVTFLVWVAVVCRSLFYIHDVVFKSPPSMDLSLNTQMVHWEESWTKESGLRVLTYDV